MERRVFFSQTYIVSFIIYQPSPERLLAPFDAVRCSVAVAVNAARTLSPTLQVLFQLVADVEKMVHKQQNNDVVIVAFNVSYQ